MKNPKRRLSYWLSRKNDPPIIYEEDKPMSKGMKRRLWKLTKEILKTIAFFISIAVILAALSLFYI